MERAGLALDHPEMPAADPDEIAQLGLDEIANGPVCVPADLVETFEMMSSMPRTTAAELMIRGAQEIARAADRA